MGKNSNNGKKKHSAFKNVMIILLCTVFAGVYAFSALYILGNIVKGNGNSTLPAWLDNVEIHVDNNSEAALAGVEHESGQINKNQDSDSLAKQYKENKNNNNSKEETVEAETELETETELEIETETELESETDSDSEKSDYENKEAKRQESTIGRVKTVDDADTPIAIVTDVTAVVEAAMPCVVAITNQYTAYDYWYDQMVDEEANGSGIIVEQNDEELLIVTNYHVIEENNSLIVQFIDNSEAEAYVKGSSPDDDLAIISVYMDELDADTINSIAIAALGDSDELKVGEPAIAIGNSLGYGQSVTTGVISALNRNIYGNSTDSEAYLIQTDAAINPGNSGGALLNVRGEVIGINSSKIADYVIEGMGYAIPISTAKPIINELVQKETKRKVAEDDRGFLGITGADVSEEAIKTYDMPEGVFVSGVLDNTAASKAGIKKGDIIVCFDDQKVTQMTALQSLLEYYKAGDEIEVVIMRQSNGEYSERTVTVKLGNRGN